MKRIWYTQQKALHINYLPLRWGLGQYTDVQIITLISKFKPDDPDSPAKYCPKIYTTRTHPLSGEYYVVEGSRFKAKPVEPRIEFQCSESYKLDLRSAKIVSDDWKDGLWRVILVLDNIVGGCRFSFPELDLGIKGATFEDLKNELLKLNKKSTIDTPFYVNKLEPI